ncbi:hypothetical protein Tco_0936751 [Tanacetum coccineum]|uniref:Uncharacterized protein n=1 Tax=Tanacetum coccineum TaxID=301880 RepID=A0ABQ5DF45_9ASTR
MLNKHTLKVEESLNVTFDETPPPSKTSPLVDDDLDEEEAIKVTEKKNLENDIEDETLKTDKIARYHGCSLPFVPTTKMAPKTSHIEAGCLRLLRHDGSLDELAYVVTTEWSIFPTLLLLHDIISYIEVIEKVKSVASVMRKKLIVMNQSILTRENSMSSTSSAVTYTSISTDSKPDKVFWGADEEISDGGSPQDIVYGYDGLPMQPPHDPDYVPEPIYPKYIPLEDEHVFPVEEQPLPPVDSPTAESPEYVAESDPEEDPEEYEDDETEDGPVDYPMDGGDDGDDDDGDSSGDDADDEDEDEEEEHLAPANSAIVIPVDEPVFPPKGTEPVFLPEGTEPVFPPEGTEPVIPPPSTDITIRARITVRPQTSISFPPEAEVERLLA